MKFTEAQLESVIIELLGEQGFPYVAGEKISRSNSEVLIEDDLRAYIVKQYRSANITASEMDSIIHQLEILPATDLYESNKIFCKLLSDNVLQKHEQKHESASSPNYCLYGHRYLGFIWNEKPVFGDHVKVGGFLPKDCRNEGMLGSRNDGVLDSRNDTGAQANTMPNIKPSISNHYYA